MPGFSDQRDRVSTDLLVAPHREALNPTDLYDFTPVGYATVTREALITQMNLATSRLLGVERGQVPDPYLGAPLIPEDRRALRASVARVLLTGQAESIEVRLGRACKTRRDLRLLIRRATPGSNGEPTTCRVILLDITGARRNPHPPAHPVVDQGYLFSLPFVAAEFAVYRPTGTAGAASSPSAVLTEWCSLIARL